MLQFLFFFNQFVLSSLNREELDISKDDEGKFTSRFTVTLDITVDAEEVKSATHTWDTLKIDKLFPQVCFSTKEEYLECQEEFGTCMIICYSCGSKGWAWASLSHLYFGYVLTAVADPGVGPGGPDPPLSQGLDDRPLPPPPFIRRSGSATARCLANLRNVQYFRPLHTELTNQVES